MLSIHLVINKDVTTDVYLIKPGSQSDASTFVALRSVALLRTTSIENVLF